MSGSDMSFQTQVASVLDALVRVAAVEITKLFETRYVASGTSTEGTERNETLEMLDGFKKLGKTCRRSIGVQVDEGAATSELPAPDQRFSSEGVSDCLMECRMEAGPTTDTPLVEVKEAADLTCTVLTEEVDMVEGSCLESESLPTRDPSTEQEICGLVDPNHLSGSAQSSTVDQEPQPPQTELKTDLNACSQAKVIISPMLPRAEEQDSAPEPECKEEPAQVELQQAMVSTTKGTADSPSSLDGAAVAPVQVSICKPPSAVKEVMGNHNHQLKQNSLDLKLKQSPLNLKLNLSSMNLKLKQSPMNLKLKLKQSPMNLKLKQSPMDLKLKHNSLDLKLLRPCSVQLVNLHLVPGSEGKKAGPGNGNQNVRQFPTPKDLRTHQHLHTGRRLCCFTQCGNGVWRLQGVLAHKQQQSRAYGCDICGKRFKRRKILRRHERFHTGEKPYSCTKCRKMFALRKSLRRHVRFHTGERPHRCPQCGKSFRVRDNLKTHLRFHTGERPFTCSSCSKSFRILRNLERHSVVHIGLEALHSK